MNKQDLIWYVGYGSNLNIERFNCYIFGGTPKYTYKEHIGSRVKQEPVQQSVMKIPYELYFSKSAKTWENKAVAFIKSKKNTNVETFCIAYLVQKNQFVDIFLQENGINPFDENLNLNFSILFNKMGFMLPPADKNRWYGRIIYLGEHKGIDAVTFTAKWDDNEVTCAAPGSNYLKTIIEGLKNNLELNSYEIVEYLCELCGIKEYFDKTEIETLVESVWK